MLSEVQIQELLVRLEMAAKGARTCPGPNKRGAMTWMRAYANDVSMLMEEIQSLQVENAELKPSMPTYGTAPTVVPIVVQKFPPLDDDL